MVKDWRLAYFKRFSTKNQNYEELKMHLALSQ